MTWLDGVSAVLLVGGCVFFTAGTVGIVRFGDLLSRLHALSKADNVGLGLLLVGLMLSADTWQRVGELAVLYAFTLVSSSIGARLLAERSDPRPDAARVGPCVTHQPRPSGPPQGPG